MVKVNRYISILLLVSFLPFVIPKEYIHDLFGHEDTHDDYHPSLIFEKKHTHCSILQITLSTFISHLKNVILRREPDKTVFSFPGNSFIPGVSVNLSHLRAPPSNHI
jgi:hypothetical protein